jgi:hypothetical protein
MANVGRVFWRSTGPQQVREDLRSSTRKMKDFFDPVVQLASLRTTWAPELDCQNLQAILSETLRKRLHDSDGQGTGSERDTTATHISTDQLRPDEILREHPYKWKSWDLTRVSGVQRFLNPDRAGLNKKKKSLFWGNEPHAARPYQDSATNSLLLPRLRNYWSLIRDTNTQVTPTLVSSETGILKASSHRASFKDRAGETHRPTMWVSALNQPTSQKLQDLSMEPVGMTGHSANEPANGSFASDAEMPRVFVQTNEKGSASDNLLDELSERLADILREQALQHGIDIT